MHKRRSEIDVKLLLYAIQRTANFESLLAKRFTGNKLSIDNAAISVENKNSTVNNTDDKTSKNPFEENEQVKVIVAFSIYITMLCLKLYHVIYT